MSFAHLAADARPPRPAGPGRRAHERAQCAALAGRASEPEDPARAAANIAVRRALAEYLRRLGVGAQFQAADFHAWLHETGRMPGADVFDPRATGGMFIGLNRLGVMHIIGYASNAGCRATNYNGTPRSVYLISDLEPLEHWEIPR